MTITPHATGTMASGGRIRPINPIGVIPSDTSIGTSTSLGMCESYGLQFLSAEKEVATDKLNVNRLYNEMANAFSTASLSPQCYHGQPSLQSQIAVGEMDTRSCKSTFAGSALDRCSGCRGAVVNFNHALNSWKAAKNELANAEVVLANIRAEATAHGCIIG